MPEKLNEKEEQAMNALWKIGEGNVKSILDAMKPPKPPYTTLASIIKGLEKKGYVEAKLIGNMYLYKTMIDETLYKKQSLTGLVKQHFGNSYKSLVAFFAEQNKISSSDLKDIINMIEKKKK